MWRKATRPIPVSPVTSDDVRGAPLIPDTLDQWIPDPSLLVDPIDQPDNVDTRPQSDAQRSPSADQSSGPFGPSRRVLLVDDRQERRALMRMVVESGPAGMSVIAEAGTVSAAIGTLDQHNPDVAVVEISTAVTAGLADIAALRAKRPSLRIVVCSFQANPATQLAATLAGANVYLTKPVSPQALLSACCTPVTAPPEGAGETQDDRDAVRHASMTA